MSLPSVFPIGDKVLLSLEKMSNTPSGLYLVKEFGDKFGKVVAVGTWVINLEIGDKVLLPTFYRPFSFEGVDYAIVKETDLDVVIRENE